MTAPRFRVEIAGDAEAVTEAQRLRYEVFIDELGGDGPLVDHAARLERDRFDPVFDHLILRDGACDGRVVGAYRLLRAEAAARAGQFYSEDEYDLAPLRASGRRLLELGRSCVARPYRGGEALWHLWQGLARYVERHEIEVLFGVASFHGTDVQALAQPLSLLHQHHLAPPALRVRARAGHFRSMDLIPADMLDPRAALREVPALVKAYLRLGGCVGEGAYVDHAFNTTDVFLVMDTAGLSAQQRARYTGGQAR